MGPTVLAFSALFSVSKGPCDIFGAAGTPCVAAHSVTRRLLDAYSGPLYAVTRKSDGTTKAIGMISSGVADAPAQDDFCAGTECHITKIFDQTAMGNHLQTAPGGGACHQALPGVNATKEKLTLGGSPVYAAYFEGGMGYRNETAVGTAKGDAPETMYVLAHPSPKPDSLTFAANPAVVTDTGCALQQCLITLCIGRYMVTSGTHYNNGCCFDYGNAETDARDHGAGTMEAIYFGDSSGWGHGAGKGPWIMADLENGLWAGDTKAYNQSPQNSTFITAMVKGDSGNHWAIKGGNAQEGPLKSLYDGVRPNGYHPMRKQGSIILGIGGDNSCWAKGTFYEGVMTSGYSTDATDEAIAANIVAAGYGK